MKRFVLKPEPAGSRPDYRIDYASVLNPAQYKAVAHGGGPALVVAGAGTGKTRTLVYRVARLIESGVEPDQIVLLTFTRRAAEDMLDRASSLLDGRCRLVRGGTFHAFCHGLLSRYLPPYTLLDAEDASDVMQLARSQSGAARNSSLFPNKHTLLAIHSAQVNRQESVDDIVTERHPSHLAALDAIKDVLTRYAEHKSDQHLLDFDDLLVRTLDLLRTDAAVKGRVSGGIRHLLLDEFQDVNALQVELATELCAVHGNIMAVGDDAQSIYGFRGSDHRHIMSFGVRFPGAVVVTLEENYRSVQPILNVANGLLNTTKQVYPKRLTATRGHGELPALVRAGTVEEQTRFIGQMVLQLRESGTDLSQIAVLFRNSRDSFDLETGLTQRGIPFVKFGGLRLSEAAHVKDVLSILRILVNPADGVAWNRALALLDGVGPKTAADFFAQIRSDAYDWTAGVRYKDQIKELLTLLTQLKESRPQPSSALRRIVAWYAPILRKKFDDHIKRAQDLDVLMEMAERYGSYAELVTKLSLEPIDATAVDVSGGEAGEKPLVLSTIHSAKGLEWKVVFVLQCLDGVIPSLYSIDHPEQVDEELRLMYVAATRAQDMLFFTYPALARSGGGAYFTKPSRFLDGFPESDLETWLLVEEGSGFKALDDPTMTSDVPQDPDNRDDGEADAGRQFEVPMPLMLHPDDACDSCQPKDEQGEDKQ
jgi:DNA helicase-2/ATP-dependent DNA helicase PcrA